MTYEEKEIVDDFYRYMYIDRLFKSVELMNEYGLSHGMGVYDAIIAATCMVYDLPLWTQNKKDFKFLDIVLVDR